VDNAQARPDSQAGAVAVPQFKEFAGTPGSATYESFSEARWEYSSFIMKRCEIASPTHTRTKD
jgi:hypothetical protein